MELNVELERYHRLKQIYPDLIFTKPGLNSWDDFSHHDILTTRYLYMKTFNSIPPENIWKFKCALNPNLKTCISNEFIDIIIGYSCQDQLVVKSKKMVNVNLTIREVFDQLKKDKNIINQNPTFSCVGSNGLIDPNTVIKYIENKQLVILENF
jgi:hypothetical protein